MISFIVPAHNEQGLIGPTLVAIRQSAAGLGRAYEIVVVDDASTDGTAAVAREHEARVVGVDYRNIAAVRNAGARAARGRVLVFVDADTRVVAGTVAAACEALAGGAVGGGALPWFDGDCPWVGRLAIGIWRGISRWRGWAAGCFIFARREPFEAVGGFDEGLFASEEIHLSAALQSRGRFVVLREPVYTSSRKVRLYSPWAHVWVLLRYALTWGRAARRREGLEVWYEGRRE